MLDTSGRGRGWEGVRVDCSLSLCMASLRGLNGFEVTSTEIVLDRARTRPGESRIFSDIDKWNGFRDDRLKMA